jgi:hypothetical protein
MELVKYRAGRELTLEERAARKARIEEAAKRPYTYDPDCPLVKEEEIKVIDLSPEQIERIKAAQKRHATNHPGCEKLTLEEFINWHPVNGILREERTRRMEAASITDPEILPSLS